MKSKRSRLDRFLSVNLSINRRDVRLLLAQGRVKLDFIVVNDIQALVDEYTHVQFDDQVLQANTPLYIQLHKPKGVVSATKDSKHTTVIDLLSSTYPKNLHIVGRLDFNSTGLLLITNDGRWSRRISDPQMHLKKTYWVCLDKPVTEALVIAFNKGIYFRYENLTTRPVQLSHVDFDHGPVDLGGYKRDINNTIEINHSVIGSRVVKVIMEEGRYHQIKRMFGQFQIEVLSLHRVSVGGLSLDSRLKEGESRELSLKEQTEIFTN